jgi:transcriptional regulator with XRE-family HTH domain
MTELRARIKELREERGLAIEEAANMLKPRTTGKTWSKWERGPGNPGGGEPDLANFRSLVAFFGVSANYLLGWTDDRDATTGADAGPGQAAASSADVDQVGEAVSRRKASSRPKPKPRRSTRQPES